MLQKKPIFAKYAVVKEFSRINIRNMSLPFQEKQSKKFISLVGLLEHLLYFQINHGQSKQVLKGMSYMDGIAIPNMEIIHR